MWRTWLIVCSQTALHFCASKNNLDTARKLIAHKASTRIKDKREQLPLHRAAAVGSVPMVQLLLDNRSPLNATDISGLTPLHHGMLPDCSFGIVRAPVSNPVTSHFRRTRRYSPPSPESRCGNRQTRCGWQFGHRFGTR